MSFLNKAKQEVKEKLTWLRLSFEAFLSESIRQVEGNQELALKPIRISQTRHSIRSMRR
jgi:hypothetical protein